MLPRCTLPRYYHFPGSIAPRSLFRDLQVRYEVDGGDGERGAGPAELAVKLSKSQDLRVRGDEGI